MKTSKKSKRRERFQWLTLTQVCKVFQKLNLPASEKKQYGETLPFEKFSLIKYVDLIVE